MLLPVIGRRNEVAFPQLTSAELALVKPLATPCDYADGETIFRAGQAESICTSSSPGKWKFATRQVAMT